MIRAVKDTTQLRKEKFALPPTAPDVKKGTWLTHRTLVNDYLVLSPLGKGSYGDVHLVKQRRTNELFALKEIKAGTELTFNYQFESVGDQKKHCLCGAKNCSGFIGEKVNNKAAKLEAKKAKLEAKKGKKKEKVKPKEEKSNKVWEDLCLR